MEKEHVLLKEDFVQKPKLWMLGQKLKRNTTMPVRGLFHHQLAFRIIWTIGIISTYL